MIAKSSVFFFCLLCHNGRFAAAKYSGYQLDKDSGEILAIFVLLIITKSLMCRLSDFVLLEVDINFSISKYDHFIVIRTLNTNFKNVVSKP